MIDFFNIGMRVIQRKNAQKSTPELRRFRTMYGVVPPGVSKLWLKLYPLLPEKTEPHHLLRRLLFLKNCNTENSNSLLVGCDEKAFRKYQWITVRALAKLNMVCFITCHFFLAFLLCFLVVSIVACSCT